MPVNTSGMENMHICRHFCNLVCKQYLSLSQNAADFYALGECGKYPLCVVYFVECIKYWLKLIALNDARYPKQCYNYDVV